MEVGLKIPNRGLGAQSLKLGHWGPFWSWLRISIKYTFSFTCEMLKLFMHELGVMECSQQKQPWDHCFIIKTGKWRPSWQVIGTRSRQRQNQEWPEGSWGFSLGLFPPQGWILLFCFFFKFLEYVFSLCYLFGWVRSQLWQTGSLLFGMWNLIFFP